MGTSLDNADFEALVREAVDGLPGELMAYVDNLDIVVREWPTREQLTFTGLTSRYELLGLYDGVPLTDRGSYNMVLPDKITIFQRPIEAICGVPGDVVREVRATVAHEVAHHFGISDKRLEALGL